MKTLWRFVVFVFDAEAERIEAAAEKPPGIGIVASTGLCTLSAILTASRFTSCFFGCLKLSRMSTLRRNSEGRLLASCDSVPTRSRLRKFVLFASRLAVIVPTMFLAALLASCLGFCEPTVAAVIKLKFRPPKAERASSVKMATCRASSGSVSRPFDDCSVYSGCLGVCGITTSADCTPVSSGFASALLRSILLVVRLAYLRDSAERSGSGDGTSSVETPSLTRSGDRALGLPETRLRFYSFTF